MQVESARLHDLRVGAEREARERQALHLSEASLHESTLARQRQVHLEHAARERGKTLAAAREYDQRVAAQTAKVEQVRAAAHASACLVHFAR